MQQETVAAVAKCQQQERELAAVRALLIFQTTSSSTQESAIETHIGNKGFSEKLEAASTASTERKRMLNIENPNETSTFSTNSQLLSVVNPTKRTKKEEMTKATKVQAELRADAMFFSSNLSK